jgi:hypothetical protein
MPVLPSGRRVEFSLDRFHALLRSGSGEKARTIVHALSDPDDLLYVLDAVHFSLEDGTPFFANYVAADWQPYAAEWSSADRQAFSCWMHSATSRVYRGEAIRHIQRQWLGHEESPTKYPYLMASESIGSGLSVGTMLQ